MATYDVSAIGFTVLDVLGCHVTALPEPGGAEFIRQIRMTVAGTAAATAVDCAILGLKGRIVAEVGEDDMGNFLVDKMQSFGLNTDLVSRHSEVQTACSMLPILKNGARTAFFVPGTSETFFIKDEDMDAALDADIIHLGGTGLLTAMDGEPSLALLKKAKALGRTTVFDLILANEKTTKLVEPLLPYIDYLVPSIDEAAQMTGEKDPAKVAQAYRSAGVKNVFLTLEGDGVYVHPEDGEPFISPAHDIEVVDTTGCGDSFTAGVIVGIAKGWDARRTSRFATAVAAQVAMGLGSDGKLKSFEDTLYAMDNLPLKQ